MGFGRLFGGHYRYVSFTFNYTGGGGGGGGVFYHGLGYISVLNDMHLHENRICKGRLTCCPKELSQMVNKPWLVSWA